MIQKRNRIAFLLTGTLSILLGFLGGVLWAHWATVAPTFYQVKVTEIIQIVVTILVAVLIGYLLNKRVGNEFRRREILADLVSRLQDTINTIYELGSEYMQKPHSNQESPILRQFKTAGALVSTLLDLKQNKHIPELEALEDSFKEQFFSLKRILTDSPFGEQGKVYPANRVSQFESKHSSILLNLYEFKIGLYQ